MIVLHVPDVHHAGVFVWAESEAEAGHTNWADGEPWSPGPEEDCVVKDGDSGRWYDYPCDTPHYALCRYR